MAFEPNSEMIPHGLVSEDSHPCTVPAHLVSGLVYVTINHGRRDDTSLF